METIVIDEDRLKIMLSKQDLARYRVEGKELDPENERVRQVLRQILDEVSELIGFPLSVGRTYIQVYESRGGGCEMFVTRLPQEFDEETPVEERLLLFSEEENRRDCCRLLLLSGYLGRSRAYRLAGVWCLLLEGTPSVSVSEFGREVSLDLVPYLTEYGQIEIPERAAEIFGATT